MINSPLSIKLYRQIIVNPKIATFTGHLWRRTFEFFVIAGNYKRHGELPPIEEIARVIHATEEDVDSVLKELEQLKITHQNDSQSWFISNVAKFTG